MKQMHYNEPSSPAARKVFNDVAWISLAKAGKNVSKLSFDTGVSRQSIYNALKYNGSCHTFRTITIVALSNYFYQNSEVESDLPWGREAQDRLFGNDGLVSLLLIKGASAWKDERVKLKMLSEQCWLNLLNASQSTARDSKYNKTYWNALIFLFFFCFADKQITNNKRSNENYRRICEFMETTLNEMYSGTELPLWALWLLYKVKADMFSMEWNNMSPEHRFKESNRAKFEQLFELLVQYLESVNPNNLAALENALCFTSFYSITDRYEELLDRYTKAYRFQYGINEKEDLDLKVIFADMILFDADFDHLRQYLEERDKNQRKLEIPSRNAPASRPLISVALAALFVMQAVVPITDQSALRITDMEMLNKLQFPFGEKGNATHVADMKMLDKQMNRPGNPGDPLV